METGWRLLRQRKDLCYHQQQPLLKEENLTLHYLPFSTHKELGISLPDHQGLVKVLLLIQHETCFRIFVLLDRLLREGAAINYFLGIGQE
jgi:hypothetical protein